MKTPEPTPVDPAILAARYAEALQKTAEILDGRRCGCRTCDGPHSCLSEAVRRLAPELFE